ncbi:MAG: hypothetical protein LIP12_16085 [Clostridiales bacterium]|nr:hypothetical protein [Clostridiales bacterium]
MYSEEDFYSLAVKNFINFSSGDATSVIARDHGLIGFARLLACLHYCGIECEETHMIALPDFTYTRNLNRWAAGFPYGCVISLPQTSIPFIPIDFRPNCCGVIFAEIPSFTYELGDLRKCYIQIRRQHENINENDLNKRNHFLGIYESRNTQKLYVLLHCSFKFVKERLYSEHNAFIDGVKSFDYLSGTLQYLTEKSAESYYKEYVAFEKETLPLREIIIQELFPDSHILFNRTHEGFFDISTILLGAYADNESITYPLMLSPEKDLYVINSYKKIKIGCRDILCAPHGGGYALASVSSANSYYNDLSTNNETFLLGFENNCSFLTNNILDMPFNYRNSTIYDWCERYNMATVTDVLRPIINLKL